MLALQELLYIDAWASAAIQGAFDSVGQDDHMRIFYLVGRRGPFTIDYHSILLYSFN